MPWMVMLVRAYPRRSRRTEGRSRVQPKCQPARVRILMRHRNSAAAMGLIGAAGNLVIYPAGAMSSQKQEIGRRHGAHCVSFPVALYAPAARAKTAELLLTLEAGALEDEGEKRTKIYCGTVSLHRRGKGSQHSEANYCSRWVSKESTTARERFEQRVQKTLPFLL
jgi:hypothetical protein